MTGIPLALRERRPVLFTVAFLCLLMLGLAPLASAAGPGSFNPTGSMSVSRIGAAAAPLPDGRGLGGGGSGRAQERRGVQPRYGELQLGRDRLDVRRARLAPPPRRSRTGGSWWQGAATSPAGSRTPSRPATNTFSSAGIGSMTVPRREAAAAPLPDGRVLLAGGTSPPAYRAPRSSTRPPTASARPGSARCPAHVRAPSLRRSPTAGCWSLGAPTTPASRRCRAPRSSTRPRTPWARPGSARCPVRATAPSPRRSQTAGCWWQGAWPTTSPSTGATSRAPRSSIPPPTPSARGSARCPPARRSRRGPAPRRGVGCWRLLRGGGGGGAGGGGPPPKGGPGKDKLKGGPGKDRAGWVGA